MTPEEHLYEVVLRTETEYVKPVQRFTPGIARLDHGFKLIAGEGAEGLDAIKKHIYYGKELDIQNLKEEVGEALYGCQIVCRALGITIEEALGINMRKLEKRYPEGFSEEKAINRDVEQEAESMK